MNTPLRKYLLITLSVILIITVATALVMNKHRLFGGQEDNTLKVAATLNGIGCYFYRQQVGGLECDLLEAYADDHGLGILFIKAGSAEDAVAMVARGEVDIATAGLSPSDAAVDGVDFSDVLFETRKVLVQRRAFAASSLSELDGRELTLPADEDYYFTLFEAARENGVYLKRNTMPTPLDGKPELTVQVSQKNLSILELIDGVSAGNIDLTLAEEHIVSGHFGQRENLNTQYVFGPSRNVVFALAQQDNNMLRDSVNRWLSSERAQAVMTPYRRDKRDQNNHHDQSRHLQQGEQPASDGHIPTGRF